MEKLQHGMVVPDACVSSGMHHGGKCRFFCNNGYRLYSSAQETRCSNMEFGAGYMAKKPKCVEGEHYILFMYTFT